MANFSGTLMKITGFALVVAGAGLGLPSSRLTCGAAIEEITGALPDAVMYRYFGGAVSVAVDLFLLVGKSGTDR
jgi:hypothetical protein